MSTSDDQGDRGEPADPTLSPAAAEALATALYRHLLGRDPDPDGLAAWTGNLLRHGIDRAIADFTAAEEFRQHRLTELWQSAASIRSLPGVTGQDAATAQRLFDIAARYWRQAGEDPGEVYFSVLTSPPNRAAFDADRVRDFVRRGAEAFGPIAEAMARHGRAPFAESACIDFGCGVGRLAINAAGRFARVYGVDFSRGHLDEMARNAALVDPALADRIEAVHLQALAELESLPPVDYCYSLLALQHNPPPVIAHLVTRLLGRLEPGGVAALHVPIHHPFYRFDLDEYLASERSGTTMEMHILPREDLRACVERSGCTIRDSLGTGYTKGLYSEVFLIARP